MEITSYRASRPGNNVRAFIDVRFENGVAVRGLRLVQTRNGLRVYGPELDGMTPVTIPPAVADDIAARAVAYARAS